VKISPHWTSGAAFTADEDTLADYDQVIKKLGDSDLAYLHLMGPLAVAGTAAERLAPFARYRALYDGAIVTNVGFTQETGNEIIEDSDADAISFGAPFIANPDLVARFAAGHPLAASDRATFYGGHSEGYTDYPAFPAAGDV
jgi:N-ethylmaleimide reductase